MNACKQAYPCTHIYMKLMHNYSIFFYFNVKYYKIKTLDSL